MRDPENLKKIISSSESISIIKMENIAPFDMADYDLFDEKEMSKYLGNIENIVRHSFEYKQMITYLRENMDMGKCAYYSNVNNADTFKIGIEIHHDPLSLYDIVNTIYNKRVFYNECLEEEAVAKEVMWIHYSLLVGLIPLSATVHELVHNNYLFIPTDSVFGNYKEFVNMYQDFMDPELLDVLGRVEECTKSYSIANSGTNVLDKKYVYLDLSGEYNLTSYTDMVEIMGTKIKQLKAPVKQGISPVTFG